MIIWEHLNKYLLLKGGVFYLNIEKLNKSLPISNTAIVKVKEMGNITELVYSEQHSYGGYITKIDKDHYVDNRTGQVKEFEHIKNRSQDLANVSKSLCRLRDLINTNVTDVSYCRWVTLTYKENMTNPKRLLLDFQSCVRSLRKVFGEFEYINAAEPQGRGAWHLHCIFIFDHKAPFMSNDVVSDCWKQGFVTVKKLGDVDNVGAYLTAYLGDMELSEAIANGIDISNSNSIKELDCIDDYGIKKKKKFIKGARLHMYPSGFNIYRFSKGIKKPEVSYMTYGEAKKEKVRSAKQTFSKTVLLKDPEKDFNNTLTYEFYNSKRK